MASNSVKKTGLAFSGGGVRSAALCSGVLRRLLQKGASIDYLSNVSGGGYTGSSYMEWKLRNGKKDDPAWHKKYFEHLQRNTNVLCDRKSPIFACIDSVVVIFLMIFLSIVILLMRAFSFVIPITFIVDQLFGDILRNQFTCKNVNKTSQVTPRQSRECAPIFGPQMGELVEISLPLFAAFVVLYYLSTLVKRRTAKYLFKFLYRLSGFGFAMVFLPAFLEMYRNSTPKWANYSIIVLVLVIWLFIPPLRETAFLTMFVLVYAYCVRWTVFQTPLAGVEYTDELYWILTWISAFLLLIHPYLAMLQINGSHLYVEWKLMRTFFSPESKKAGLFCHCSKEKPITVADLEEMRPEYKCSVTANQWRKNNEDFEKDYEALIVSPTTIERLDRKQGEKEFNTEGFIKTKDIRLSSVMTTSASAISYDEGESQDPNKSFRELRVVLGMGFGNNLVVQTGLTKSWMAWVVTLFFQVVLGVCILAIPLALYFGALQDWSLWLMVLMALLLTGFVLLAFISILPIDGNGFCTTLIRWCIINILHVRVMRTLFDVIDAGPQPPPVMSLSDGGHVENLGLLPLFKLRLHRIVSVNGGALLSGDTYASDLLKALRQAREKLRCSFTGLSGRDIIEDIRDHFVEKEPGQQPRSYRFKVQYYEKDGWENKLVDEGEVLMLMPRYPGHGITQFQDCKWSDFDDDDVKLDLDESAWGRGPALKPWEVDRLSGCCCECCHSKPFNFILNSLMGSFPFHSTINQMFTPTQFTAYHREGYHACLEAKADKFLVEHSASCNVVTNQPTGLSPIQQDSVSHSVIQVAEL